MGKRTISAEEAKAMGVNVDSLPVDDATGEPGHPGYDYTQEDPHARTDKLPPERPFGTVKDAAITWANDAPFGAGPQIQGLIAAIVQDAKNVASGHPMTPPEGETPRDAYRSVRDDAKKQRDESASTYLGSVGAAVAPFTTPMPIKGLPRGATAMQRGGRGAWTGATAAGLTGLAQSDADLTEPTSENIKEAALDTVGSAVPGAVAGFTIGAASRIPAKIGEKSEELSKRAAMSSLGMTKGDRGQLARSGKGEDVADLLQSKALGWSRGGTAEKTAAELAEAGADIGRIRGAVDKAAGGKTIDPTMIGAALRDEAKRIGASTPEAKAVADELIRRAEMAEAHGGGALISLDEAERVFKSPLNEFARKAKVSTGEPPASLAARESARDVTAKYNEEQTERLAKLLAPELAGKYGEAKQRYAVAKELARILQKSEPEAFAKKGAIEPFDMPGLDLDIGGNSEGVTGGLRTAVGKALSGATLPAMSRVLKAGGKLQDIPTGGAASGRLMEYFDSMREADERRKKK